MSRVNELPIGYRHMPINMVNWRHDDIFGFNPSNV